MSEKKVIQDLIFTTKGIEAPVCEFLNEKQQWIKLKQKKYFVGDVYMEIKHSPFVGKNLASTFMFNTGFIDSHKNIVYVNLDDLSPLSSTKNGNFHKNFQFEIYFQKNCNCQGN